MQYGSFFRLGKNPTFLQHLLLLFMSLNFHDMIYKVEINVKMTSLFYTIHLRNIKLYIYENLFVNYKIYIYILLL